MIKWMDCSLNVQVGIFCVSVLLMFAQAFCAVMYVWYRRGIARTLITFILLITHYFLVQSICCHIEKAPPSQRGLVLWIANLPAAVIVAYLMVGILFFVFQQREIQRWVRGRILPSSIKESLDMLPDGLCYYREGGFPKLINAKMEELSWKMMGEALMNGEAFWNHLCEGKALSGAVCVQQGEQPVWELADGGVYSFCRREKEWENSFLYEILAVDVTKEHQMGEKLREKRARESEINNRLRDVSRTLTKMTIEKEVLGMKINVHDNLGQVLLQTRRYLKQSDSGGKEEILRQWQSVVTLLENEKPESWQDSYVEGFRRTALLGVDIQVNGELPETEPARSLVNLAVSTCATNVIRHAKGNVIEINCAQTEEVLTLAFTNSGEVPKEEVKETGGLNNLRTEVERAGGVMKIQSRPRFALILILPKTEKFEVK